MSLPPKKDPLLLRLAALSLKAVRAVSSLFPLRLLTAAGAGSGALMVPFFPREQQVISAQLRMVARQKKTPGTEEWHTPAAARKIGSACFRHAGESITEAFAFPRLLASGAVTHVNTEEEKRFHDAFQSGSGVLALSAHIGCFELLAASHVYRKVPVSVVGRLPNYEGLGRLLADLRAGYGVETLWRESSGGARRLISALKQGRVVAVLLDQDTDLESIYPRFFGVPAASPVAPVRLAVKMSLPIISTFIVRTSRLQHQVFTEMIPYDAADPAAELRVLECYNQRLEKLICRYPGQWLWWHRRWRREPEVDYIGHPELLRGTEAYLRWLEGVTTS